MSLSILAGMMIAIGGIVNLSLGGIAGAVFFSVGLLTILHFKLNLFTGRAGLLATKGISPLKLSLIWLGNLIGTAVTALLISFTTIGQNIAPKAVAIMAIRSGNGVAANIILGIFCGVLMYTAVKGYRDTKNPIFVVFPVSVFILAGFNHCVADMFYCWMALFQGQVEILGVLSVLLSTLGNVLGCNLLPILVPRE